MIKVDTKVSAEHSTHPHQRRSLGSNHPCAPIIPVATFRSVHTQRLALLMVHIFIATTNFSRGLINIIVFCERSGGLNMCGLINGTVGACVYVARVFRLRLFIGEDFLEIADVGNIHNLVTASSGRTTQQTGGKAFVRHRPQFTVEQDKHSNATLTPYCTWHY